MGFFQKILGSASGNIAEVDANNQLLVRPATTLANIGYGALAGRSDPGGAGSARIKPIWVTSNNKLPIAQTLYLWDDTFNATAQNTAKYRCALTTQTMAQTGGSLIFNNSGITTNPSTSAYQTFRNFPVFGNSELRVIFSGGFNSATTHVANNTTEIGLFTVATLTGQAAPQDGVFFRWNTANELRGVISYNGTETQTVAITKPADNVNHDFMLIINTDVVEFWVDREFRAAIQLVTDAPTLGQPFSQATLPLTMRQYINSGPPASATKLTITDVFVVQVGPDTNKPWQHIKAGMGHMGYQGQNGGTMGSTANLGNGAIPAATALTNTALGTGNPAGLGGVAHVLPTLTAGTDGIVVSYQVPPASPSITQTGRNLVVTGVNIQGLVDVIFAGGPVYYLYSLAFGHTAVSLATAESASFTTGTTKAPRRIWLGYETYIATAPVGTLGQGIHYQFTEPIYVAVGEFIALCARNLGTVTTTGSIAISVSFDAHFE